MIDKNDVKMPVQKREEALSNDSERIAKIEELLRLVNDADNRQELRLKEDSTLVKVEYEVVNSLLLI